MSERPYEASVSAVSGRRPFTDVARDATRLEKLVFRSNKDEQRLRLPTHLPRLTARGKFRAERRPNTVRIFVPVYTPILLLI